MDREKQIEEIAKAMCEYCKEMCGEDGCPRLPFSKENFDKECFVYRIEEAENLYEKGYRKIKDNEIVVSKEEYEGLINQNKGLKEENHILRLENNDLEAQVELKSKETAREIFLNAIAKVKERFKQTKGYTTCYDIVFVLTKLAEKYGVDLGEEQ